jgi:hypothetical protein
LLETTAICEKLRGENNTQAFINLALDSSSDPRLLLKSASSAKNPPQLDGPLGIKLLVWFLVDSVVRSADKFNYNSLSVFSPLRKALSDVGDLVNSSQPWCSVRYSIRVIHKVHDAFSALIKESQTQEQLINSLKTENKTLQAQIQSLRMRISIEAATTIRVRD